MGANLFRNSYILYKGTLCPYNKPMFALNAFTAALSSESGALNKLRQHQLDGFRTFLNFSGGQGSTGEAAKLAAPLIADIFQKSL